ncbi:hypothetical protein [Dysgonomonas sp. ZJ279]|uniref:CIS tube protein n=1 Tax=Dysgonomonas sp. ZJ279 TaxID=2709796 RepID=UPI0013EC38C7|nr:hypothetical protein [Dysgonomonas sp. ZJ279]
MAGLEKMVLTGYEKSDYKGGYKEFTAQINPASISWSKEIAYEKDEVIGSGSNEIKYKGHQEDKLSFKIVLDNTGALFNPKQTTVQTILGSLKTIPFMINQLEHALYTIDSESHEPRYVIIIWGAFCFEGRATSLSYDYTLFSPEGMPLRVTASLSFSSHLNKSISNKKENKKSPDLTRVITLKAGESIAGWCNKIYNDPSFCSDVARCNGLSSFRNIEPGISLIFPPLNRNGRITDKR